MTRAMINLFAAASTALSMLVGMCQPLVTELSATLAPAEYDYTQPVPGGEQREDDWFDGSAIIGHSLIEGFQMFSNVDSSIHYFTHTGLSARGAASYDKYNLPNGGTGTLTQGLRQRDFSKIYIMLGVNEISTSKERFQKSMAELVELVRANQPEGTPIYILGITPTTKAKSDSSDFSLKNVQKMNEALAALCEEQQCYLVDLYACFADENGYLPADISTDGVHLKAPQYRVMADYILSHTAEEQ